MYLSMMLPSVPGETVAVPMRCLRRMRRGGEDARPAFALTAPPAPSNPPIFKPGAKSGAVGFKEIPTIILSANAESQIWVRTVQYCTVLYSIVQLRHTIFTAFFKLIFRENPTHMIGT